MIGTTIGPYKVLAKLGEGGMGTVWKAEDDGLHRQAALKFVSGADIDDELRARLIREAQAAAKLDHHNICSVYGIHEDAGATFIAMAYIDGPSLADKIKQRPLPLDEALDLAIQIAEGLHEAHEKGVVHRDVKPANVMLTSRGQVKIMDFGLALVSNRTRLTQPDTSPGTPLYMAPEQLEGSPVDRRADIWALGCVLYEMLTQRAPFDEEYEQAIAFSILNEDPEPVTALRAGLPPQIDTILAKALEKDPAERYQTLGDFLVDLRALRKQGRDLTPRASRTRQRQDLNRGRPWWKTAVGYVAVGLLALVAGLLLRDASTPPGAPENRPPPLRMFSIRPELPLFVLSSPGREVSISPNGRYIAYMTRSSNGNNRESWLWVHDLQQGRGRRVEDVDVAKSPFWTPDSEFIIFGGARSILPGRLVFDLLKTPVQGGETTVICEELPSFRQGSVSADGETVFIHSGSPGRAYSVPFRGGTLEPVFTDEESAALIAGLSDPTTDVGSFPHALPSIGGSRGLVFGIGFSTQMLAGDLNRRDWNALGPGREPFFSPTGHLLYVDDAADLWALPFSPQTFKASGPRFRVREDVDAPSVSNDGTLVYFESVSAVPKLVWRDRTGKHVNDLVDGWDARVSLDGSQIAFVGGSRRFAQVEVLDLARGTRIKLAEGQFEAMPVWSPDGTSVAISSMRSGGDIQIFIEHLDGDREAQPLLSEHGRDFATDWSPDGRFLVFQRNQPSHRTDLVYAELHPETGAWSQAYFRRTEFDESNAVFSPDGRRLAYRSNETGRYEIIVRDFPAGTNRRIVSLGDGPHSPMWSRDSGEILYVADGKLWSVRAATDSDLARPAPQEVFSIPVGYGDLKHVSADGSRFLFAEPPAESPEPLIWVVENWIEQFRD